MRRCLGVWAGVLLAAVWDEAASAQAPEGPEFQVSVVTTDYQGAPVVTSDGSGNFVVVWKSYGQDGDQSGIRGRRYSAAGLPLNTLGSVNSYTTSFQDRPSVAADASGNFVVVWQSENEDGNQEGIFGQRFGFSGARRGPEFQVNTITGGQQYFPAVASDASGNFVVVWTSGDMFSGDVHAQRFDSSGTPQGGEFVVNTYTPGGQRPPTVASDPAGNFFVVWLDPSKDGSGSGIFGRRFDASGNPQGAQFRINSHTAGDQYEPSVALDPAGNTVVVWRSAHDGDGYGIFGRRYDASGVPQGSEFQVNTYTTSDQLRPTVAMDGHGNFVVVWQGQDAGAEGIRGQRFDAAGVPQGSEFQVNTYTTSFQGGPSIALDPDGDFTVVWTSSGQDGSGFGAFGQRFGDLLFEDGFESGDLSRWSSDLNDVADLSVTGAAGQAGTPHGMEAFVDDTNSLYVQDDTPDGESRYRARFYFDPGGFDPGEASGHQRVRICLAFDDVGVRVVSIVLKRLAGAYSVEARVRQDDGSRVDTGFFDITDAPHFVEFDWQRSSAPGATDGLFTLRLDNAIVSTLNALDNDTLSVGYVRMGAMSVKTGATGTLHFDQFESRRRVFIGPE